MKCAWCREVIEGEPVWSNDKAYCSDECSNIDSTEAEEDIEEDTEQDDVEEEEEK